MKTTLTFLFIFTTAIVFSQNGNQTKAATGLTQTPKEYLTKMDESTFSSSEEAIVNSYIASLGSKVTFHNFDSGRLYLVLANDYKIIDLMEGLKERGISVVYYTGKEMLFINDNLKLETWDTK